jgi:glycosyltransferase involved in cell wall biosynthesis
MKICIIILRTDIDSKEGGDLVQFKNIAKCISIKKNQVDIVSWNPNLVLKEYDIVHFVNDRPLILADALRQAQREQKKIVFSPIHHSDDEVITLRSYAFPLTRSERLMSLLFQTFFFKRSLLHYINILADLRMIQSEYGYLKAVKILKLNFIKVRTKNILGKEIQIRSNLQFLSTSEAISFMNDYKINIHKYNLIPNGVPTTLTKVKQNANYQRIICVGRVEPRKRVYELAKIADKLCIKVDFIGSTPMTPNIYSLKFLELSKKSKYVNYLGAMSHDGVINEMQKSTVLINCSFAEVLSLVELEAAFSGNYIISCGSGASQEYIPPSILKFFPVLEIDIGLLLAKELSKADLKIRNLKGIDTWDDIAKLYFLLYKKTLLQNLG